MSDDDGGVRRKSRVRFVLRFIVSFTLVGLLLSRVEWSELREIGGSLQPLWLVPIFSGMLVVTILSTLKWNMFLRADGIRLPFWGLVANYLTGVFFSLFLPSNIGGDVYRVVTVGREAGKSKALAAVMMGRLTGFFVLASIGLAAAIVSIDRIGDPRVAWGIGGVLFAIVVAFVLVCSRRLLALGKVIVGAVGLDKVGRVAERVQDSILIYRSRPAIVIGALFVSVLQQGMMIFTVYLMSLLVGLEISALYFFAFIPVIEAAAAIPITVFGVGVRDGLYVLLFGTVGVTHPQCLSMSFMYVTVSVIFASSGGLLYLLRPSPTRAAR